VRRSAGRGDDGLGALERREVDLAKQVAEVARRILQVDESIVPEVRAALQELKHELARVRSAAEAKRRDGSLAIDAERKICEMLDTFRARSGLLRDLSIPLERRRAVPRHFLTVLDGVRPIRLYFDHSAGKGWKRRSSGSRCATSRRAQGESRPKW